MLLSKLFTLISFSWLVIAIDRSLIVYDTEKIDLKNSPDFLKNLVTFFNANNHEVVLRGYTDDDLSLVLGGEMIFNNLILLPTSSKKITKKDQLNKQILYKLSENSGNIIIVGDKETNYPDEIREFLNEIGIYPSPKGYSLIDHFESNDNVKLTPENLGCKSILSEIDTEYDGQSAILNNNENLISILKSSKTSVSTNDKINAIDNDNSWGVGQQSHIIVGLQSLNDGRITWLGSKDLLSNEILSWSVGSRNLLKLQFVQHHKADEPEHPDGTLYRIKDQVIYTIGVSELIDNEWKPYVTPQDDAIQLSFKMLDPYQRLNLQPLGETSSTESGPLDTYVYYTNFTIPDQHGMFTFELDYKREGLSYLSDKKVVAVRHLANDEFKRSWEIPNAWFYVASAGFVVLGWLIFVIKFMYVSKPDVQKKNQ